MTELLPATDNPAMFRKLPSISILNSFFFH